MWTHCYTAVQAFKNNRANKYIPSIIIFFFRSIDNKAVGVFKNAFPPLERCANWQQRKFIRQITCEIIFSKKKNKNCVMLIRTYNNYNNTYR